MRVPAAEGTFLYDLTDPVLLETIRTNQMPFVQWDVLFDLNYRANIDDAPSPLSPETNRPELLFLRLPYRF